MLNLCGGEKCLWKLGKYPANYRIAIAICFLTRLSQAGMKCVTYIFHFVTFDQLMTRCFDKFSCLYATVKCMSPAAPLQSLYASPKLRISGTFLKIGVIPHQDHPKIWSLVAGLTACSFTKNAVLCGLSLLCNPHNTAFFCKA